MPHRLNIGKAQTAPGLKLPLVDGHYAASENFRHICPGINAKGDYRNDNLAYFHRAKDNKINNHQLHQHRRSPDNGQIQLAEKIADFQLSCLVIGGTNNRNQKPNGYTD